MKLKSLIKYIGLIILTISFSHLLAEEEINIWSKEKKDNLIEKNLEINSPDVAIDLDKIDTNRINNKIQIKIENEALDFSKIPKVFGIYDPEENNFDLNMWSSTKAEDLKASLKRIKKLKLSKISNEILEKILLSFSYPPQGMKDKEFVDLKIDWLIENNYALAYDGGTKQNWSDILNEKS